MSDRKKCLNSISDLLAGSHPTLRQIERGAAELKPFQRAWPHLLPHPASNHVRPAFFSEGRLTVWVDSPLWANWIRHRHDSLINDIAKQGLPEVHTLTVRPSPGPACAETAPHKQEASEKTAKIIDRTARDIADPELRQSLQKLVKTLGNSR